MFDHAKTLKTMLEAALLANTAILEIYGQNFSSTQKADGTPVTLADQTAENVILRHLAPTGIVVLAEESVSVGRIPDLEDIFFVVDPLDGTKEFVKRNGEFTVNIALIQNGRPVCGIVTVPAQSKGYIGSPLGAFNFDIVNGVAMNNSQLAVKKNKNIKMLISRSHADPRLASLRQKLDDPECNSVGSSLKLCMLAQGAANLYLRFSPTHEWDIAAGQAVLEAAGGSIFDIHAQSLSYGKVTENFKHPALVAAASQELALKAGKLMREQC